MFALAVTDPRWHDQMLSDPPTGLVNFWTPTPWKVQLKPGSRWGFMLKSPIRRIGGFGSLVTYEEVTVEHAWERWGLANGVQSLADFRSRIIGFASRRSSAPIIGNDPTIGCVLLDACVFLPADQQPTPEELGLSFQPQIVKWKGFEGELHLAFEDILPKASAGFKLVDRDGANWEQRRTKKRIAQGLFRRDVLEAYGRQCAATGTACEQVLEAAHIQPFVNLKSNHVQNGIAFRRDVHCLFDAGLLTIRPDYTIQVSPYLTATPYKEMEGRKLALPASLGAAPAAAAISYHRSQVFRSGETSDSK
ncbi:MAG TPA: HNH endonuclease [Sphingomicrobium sp.]|nr:HNH endonuclease [Sphingomicrobium sp.]